MATSPMTPPAVLPLLRGTFGRPYVWHDSCRSTQELARDLPHGGVAACDVQTAGRGRLGRTWVSPPGAGILFSLALVPRTPPGRLPPLTLVVADAVCAALGGGTAVRWPNDVVAADRKVAGVLAEVRGGHAVVGVGVNANQEADGLPAEARVPATSLRLLRGVPVDRAAVLADLLEEIERGFAAFERDGFTGLRRDELRGRRVRLAGGAEGECAGVDGDGRLVVAGRPHTTGEVSAVAVES
jgi:BirA family transcriptional regulator, biotin operon repressor / biotin---[acetyl-CoA-carboxylase] ligase